MEKTKHSYNLRRKRQVNTDETTREEVALPAGPNDTTMADPRSADGVEDERIPRHVLEASSESETEDGGR